MTKRGLRAATDDQVALAIKRFGTRRAAAELRRRGLMAPIAGGAGWTLVSATHLTAYTSTQASTIQYAANVTAGNVGIVVVGTSASPIPTITCADNATGGSNTYAEKLTATDGNTSARASIFAAPIVNGNGTRPTVTVTLSSTSAFGTVVTLLEVAGIATTLDVSSLKNTGAASAAPAAGPTGATAAANEFCVGAYCDGATTTGTITAGSGWTDEGSLIAGGVDYASEIKDSGASGSTVTANWTLSAANAGYCGAVGVFILSGPPPVPTQSTLRATMKARN